jgi:hypothetical protein
MMTGKWHYFISILPKLAWISCSVALIAYTCFVAYGPNPPRGDYTMGIIFPMFLLTFPIGFVAMFLCAVLPYKEFPALNSFLVCWLIFFILGYLQWFVLIPKLKAIKLRRYGSK